MVGRRVGTSPLPPASSTDDWAHPLGRTGFALQPAPLGRARRRYRSYTNSGRGATRKTTGGRGARPAASSVGAAGLKTIAAAGGTRGRAMMPTIPPCKGPAQRLGVSLAFPTCNLAIRR